MRRWPLIFAGLRYCSSRERGSGREGRRGAGADAVSSQRQAEGRLGYSCRGFGGGGGDGGREGSRKGGAHRGRWTGPPNGGSTRRGSGAPRSPPPRSAPGAPHPCPPPPPPPPPPTPSPPPKRLLFVSSSMVQGFRLLFGFWGAGRAGGRAAPLARAAGRAGSFYRPAAACVPPPPSPQRRFSSVRLTRPFRFCTSVASHPPPVPVRDRARTR